MKKCEEKTLLNAVLTFLIRGGKICLAMKKKKIGQGKLNGYGGGIEVGETTRYAAVRELNEEGQIVVIEDDLEKVAIVNFRNHKEDGLVFVCRVHIFFVTKWSGEPKETEEMGKPLWFDFDAIPVGQLLPADADWLSRALDILDDGQPFEAWYEYGPHQEFLIGEGHIEEVDVLPEE